MENSLSGPHPFEIRGTEYLLNSISLEDVDQMQALDQKCFPPEIAFTEGYFRLLFYYDKAFGWSLSLDDKIIAFILLTPHRNKANIATIDVSPRHRRKGIGSALVSFAEKTLADSDYHSVFLQVHVDNSGAIQLYQQAGYSVVKTLPDYYPTGDALLMRKIIKAAK